MEKPAAPFDRITQNPEVKGGKPCIRGMRVTVGMIVGQLGAGRAIDDLLMDYPYLEREDVVQALRKPLGEWKSERFRLLNVEGSGRYEFVAALGSDAGERRG